MNERTSAKVTCALIPTSGRHYVRPYDPSPSHVTVTGRAPYDTQSAENMPTRPAAGMGTMARTESSAARGIASSLPAYRDLPVRPGAPPHSAWGVFGDDDQLGTLNLLTAERVLRAASLVRKGAVFPLDWDLEKPAPPMFDRQPLRHTIAHMGEGTDDRYDSFYPQASSQWDALSHIGHPEHGFYNGCRREDITGRPGSRNGIDNAARHGIVGRFVLADIERHRRALGGRLDVTDGEAISVDELDAVLAREGVALETGDILLLRFGWISWWESASQSDRDALHRQLPDRSYLDGPRVLPEEMPTFTGLDRGERTAAWLWDHHVAAVAADCPSIEPMPFDMRRPDGFLHYRLIPLLGMTLGEFWALDDLAADCTTDGIYEGLLTAAPLNKTGGSGSPANALAVK
jgi:kynurenine formamidase